MTWDRFLEALPGIAAALTALVAVYLMRANSIKITREAEHSQSTAAEALTKAARELVALYQEKNNAMTEENLRLTAEVAEVRKELHALARKVERVRSALLYLCNEVKVDYPAAVQIAQRMAGIETESDVLL